MLGAVGTDGCGTGGGPPPAAALSVQQARLVGGHHVLDVDEGILSAIALEGFQRLLDQVANVLPLLLAVVDAISGVHWFGQTNKEAVISRQWPRASPTHPPRRPGISRGPVRRHWQVTPSPYLAET